MKLSLRMRVLLLVAAINAAMFGSGLLFLAQRLEGERVALSEQFSEPLLYTLQTTITSGGEINVAPILRWPSWRYFEDAIILRASWELGSQGDILPQGAFFNPLGCAHRKATFDQQGVLRDIVQAVVQRQTTSSHGGKAVPILDAQGRVWGGCWYVFGSTVDTRALVLRLLPWFLLSTALLTLGTFSMLRRFVLDPVQQLAAGAQRVQHGDLSVRLKEPARSDEMSELIRGFNTMTATVQGFNERLAHEVEIATEHVRRAEAAAMMQRRLASTGELAAGIAHEINNPLGGLLNAVEVLSRDDLPPEKKKQYHDLLKNGLERIQATVGRLLHLTPRTTRPGPVALLEPVQDAIALVQHRATQQNVQIELQTLDAELKERERVLELWRALPPFCGESNEIAQAMLNLLVNALDALERVDASDRRITVRLGARGDELALVVEDNGPGVQPADLPRVADLFYTTKPVGKGTGLGLAIVHGVVAHHGGRMHLASRPGEGFKVEITLPIWRAEAPLPRVDRSGP